ncbi:MAG: hypothetical protein ABI585_08285 [Betaproteobacteria bacterium]
MTGGMRLALCLLLLAAAASFARAAPATGVAADGSEPPVRFEAIAGTSAKRVILAQKAADRLDIRLGSIVEDAVTPMLWVGGRIAARSAASAAGGRAGGTGELDVVVKLSRGEASRLAANAPARVLPLATRERSARESRAVPAGRAGTPDPSTSMQALTLRLESRDSGFKADDRVRVGLPLAGAAGRRLVVPYGAVYYDATGAAWVYVAVQPLAYERRRITVAFVTDDRAVLDDGPPAGTPVVVTGASLLYGAEIFGR